MSFVRMLCLDMDAQDHLVPEPEAAVAALQRLLLPVGAPGVALQSGKGGEAVRTKVTAMQQLGPNCLGWAAAARLLFPVGVHVGRQQDVWRKSTPTDGRLAARVFNTSFYMALRTF